MSVLVSQLRRDLSACAAEATSGADQDPSIGHRMARAMRVRARAVYLLRLFPTLLVWGTRDRVIPAPCVGDRRASPRRRTRVLLDGVRHLPQLIRALTRSGFALVVGVGGTPLEVGAINAWVGCLCRQPAACRHGWSTGRRLGCRPSDRARPHASPRLRSEPNARHLRR